MMRDMLDDYLDGTLDAGHRADVERQLLADPAAAGKLARMKRERALRSAAMASFEPAQSEASAVAARTLAKMYDATPAGYVGMWMRRGMGVAAAIAIVVGSFAIGRVTSQATPAVVIAPKSEPQVVYRVVYFAEFGDKEVREFASLDETNEFVNKLDAKRAEPQVAAVDLNSSGSF